MNKNTINIIINLFRIKLGLDKASNMIDNYISMSKENNLNDIQRDGYKKYHNIIEKELEELRLEIQAIIEKEQELVTEELKNSGKPEDIAKKLA